MLSAIMLLVDGEDGKNKMKRLFIEYSPIMKYEAMKVLDSKEDAEDAVQDTFIKIIRYLDRIDPDDKRRTRALLMTVCRNAALDILRKNIHRSKIDTTLGVNEEDPEKLFIDAEGVATIERAINALSPRYRDAMILRYINDYTPDEIANLLNISYDAVLMRLSRARAALAKILEEKSHEIL